MNDTDGSAHPATVAHKIELTGTMVGGDLAEASVGRGGTEAFFRGFKEVAVEPESGLVGDGVCGLGRERRRSAFNATSTSAYPVIG